jgi:hypothetical protein
MTEIPQTRYTKALQHPDRLLGRRRRTGGPRIRHRHVVRRDHVGAPALDALPEASGEVLPSDLFERPGVGLSDRGPGRPLLELQRDDRRRGDGRRRLRGCDSLRIEATGSAVTTIPMWGDRMKRVGSAIVIASLALMLLPASPVRAGSVWDPDDPIYRLDIRWSARTNRPMGGSV